MTYSIRPETASALGGPGGRIGETGSQRDGRGPGRREARTAIGSAQEEKRKRKENLIDMASNLLRQWPPTYLVALAIGSASGSFLIDRQMNHCEAVLKGLEGQGIRGQLNILNFTLNLL